MILRVSISGVSISVCGEEGDVIFNCYVIITDRPNIISLFILWLDAAFILFVIITIIMYCICINIWIFMGVNMGTSGAGMRNALFLCYLVYGGGKWHLISLLMGGGEGIAAVRSWWHAGNIFTDDWVVLIWMGEWLCFLVCGAVFVCDGEVAELGRGLEYEKWMTVHLHHLRGDVLPDLYAFTSTFVSLNCSVVKCRIRTLSEPEDNSE